MFQETKTVIRQSLGQEILNLSASQKLAYYGLMVKKQVKTILEIIITALAWICVILGLVAAWYGVYVTEHAAGKFSLTNLSNLGSYAQGSVSSLWSLGALFFLYATLLAQRQQIAQQERQIEQQQAQFKLDMEKRKHENEQQEKQFQLQQEAIQLQNFESSFFQLLQIFNQTISDLKDYREVSVNLKDRKTLTYERRECFTLWYKLLKENFNDELLDVIANLKLPSGNISEYLINTGNEGWGQQGSNSLPKSKTDERIVKLYFESFYEKHQALLGHYFRILYHIVKFVDQSTALKTQDAKRRYVSLVRAQLSAHELILIFYNGISIKAVKFRPLIEKYGILEHLDKKLLLDSAHNEFYSPGSYK